MLFVVLLGLLVPAAALAAFPGTDPSESPRANTPNDPDFDTCEADDPNTSPPRCTSYFDEQYGAFGFSPDSANAAPAAAALGRRHALRQLLAARRAGQGREHGRRRSRCAQVSGVSADRAWKYSTGTASVQVAILDTGIRWDKGSSCARRSRLNRGRAADPPATAPPTCAQYDCNSDGAFNVDDYANDPRVARPTADDDEPDADASSTRAT